MATIEPRSVEPELIQGGMGVGVSNWQLARAVAEAGERAGRPVLGVVSGTGLAITIVLRLGKGDQDARRAIEAFPVPEIGLDILERFWLNRSKSAARRLPPKPEILVRGSDERKTELAKLIVAANFAEVWLAKQGHCGPVGINYLEKVQLPRLPELLGAMMAGVDYVLMGAGIPNQVPGVLDDLAEWRETSYRIDVAGGERHVMTFDPGTVIPDAHRATLRRPRFLAIVSHHALAQALALKANGIVDGFVVEGPVAGGHNAPARGKELSESGEPVYGERDRPDLAKIRDLGRPFWLAGGYSTAARLKEAKGLGAAGIQVGSAFALCEESGLRTDIKRELIREVVADGVRVKADPLASPSGFPFQVVQLGGSLSDPAVYAARQRSCSLGYLVQPYAKRGGGIGFRCPAEPVKAYVRKGGAEIDASGRICLCNGLAAACRDGQPTGGQVEPPIATLGQDHGFVAGLLGGGRCSYTAADVVSAILA